MKSKPAKDIVRVSKWIRLIVAFICIKFIYSLLNSLEFVEASQQILFTNYSLVVSLWIIASVSMYDVINHKAVISINILVILFLISYFIGWSSIYDKIYNITRKFLIRNVSKITNQFHDVAQYYYDVVRYIFVIIYDALSSYMSSIINILNPYFIKSVFVLKLICNYVEVYIFGPIHNGFNHLISLINDSLYHIFIEYIIKPISECWTSFISSISNISTIICNIISEYLFDPFYKCGVAVAHMMGDTTVIIYNYIYQHILIPFHSGINSLWIMLCESMGITIQTFVDYILIPISNTMQYCYHSLVAICISVGNEIIDNIIAPIHQFVAYLLSIIGDGMTNLIQYLLEIFCIMFRSMIEYIFIPISKFSVYIYSFLCDVSITIGNNITIILNASIEVISDYIFVPMTNVMNQISNFAANIMGYCYDLLVFVCLSVGDAFSMIINTILEDIIIPLQTGIISAFIVFSEYVLIPIRSYIHSLYTLLINSVINAYHSVVSYICIHLVDPIVSVLFNAFNFMSEVLSIYYIKYCSEIILNDQNVYISINNRYATILYSFDFENLDEFNSQNLKFDIEIAPNAFISNFIAKIDNKILIGETKEKQRARIEYNEAIETSKNAVLISQDDDANTISIETNINKNGRAQLNVTIEQFITKKFGFYELSLSMKNQYLSYNILSGFDNTNYHIDISDNNIINNIDIPSSNNIIYDNQSFVHYLIKERFKEDWIRMNPTQFILRYKTINDDNNGNHNELLYDEENNTFCHIFCYDQNTVNTENIGAPRRVMFVIDKSGSMHDDNKWNQAINATIGALMDLNLHSDRMDIVLFDSNIKTFKNNMRTISPYLIDEAKLFLLNEGKESNKKGEGGTNINKALLESIDLIKKDIIFNKTDITTKQDLYFINQIILITDGAPTVGVIDTNKIITNIDKANIDKNILIFGLGIGDDTGKSWIYDLNYPFIRSLSIKNGGFDKRIKKSETQNSLNEYYKILKYTILSNINVSYYDDEESFIQISELTNNYFTSLYQGTDLVICGKINNGNYDISLSVNMTATAIDGKRINLWFDGNNNKCNNNDNKIERTWAYLKLLSYRNELILNNDNINLNKHEINQKATQLALKYKFVTQWTSMIVVDKQSSIHSTKHKSRQQRQYDRRTQRLRRRKERSMKRKPYTKHGNKQMETIGLPIFDEANDDDSDIYVKYDGVGPPTSSPSFSISSIRTLSRISKPKSFSMMERRAHYASRDVQYNNGVTQINWLLISILVSFGVLCATIVWCLLT